MFKKTKKIKKSFHREEWAKILLTSNYSEAVFLDPPNNNIVFALIVCISIHQSLKNCKFVIQVFKFRG